MNTPQTRHLPVSADLELQTGLFCCLAILEEAFVYGIVVGEADLAGRPRMQIFREEKKTDI